MKQIDLSISAITTMEWAVIIAFMGVLVVSVAVFLSRARRNPKGRTQRVDAFHVRVLAAGDQAHFRKYWREVQARFVDGPAGAIMAADQLLCDVMSTRGYPLSDVEQRATDIFVDHPLVLANYRKAHDVALLQLRGEASTEELCRAMGDYTALFEELVSEREMPLAGAAS